MSLCSVKTPLRTSGKLLQKNYGKFKNVHDRRERHERQHEDKAKRKHVRKNPMVINMSTYYMNTYYMNTLMYR